MGHIMNFIKPQGVYNGKKKLCLRHKHLVIFWLFWIVNC